MHDQAVSLLAKLRAERTPFAVTEWVFAEFLSGASFTAHRTTAAALVRSFSNSPSVTVIHASHADFEQALGLFETRPDKEWSLVDCSSILACQQRSIQRVFTHDRHFQQAGFETLLR